LFLEKRIMSHKHQAEAQGKIIVFGTKQIRRA
jgi:hypothetical protein